MPIFPKVPLNRPPTTYRGVAKDVVFAVANGMYNDQARGVGATSVGSSLTIIHPPQYGRAFSLFSFTNSEIAYPYNQLIGGLGEMTVMTVIRRRAVATNWDHVVCQRQASPAADGFAFMHAGTGTYGNNGIFFNVAASGTEGFVGVDNCLTQNQWHVAIATFDGAIATATNRGAIYVDGYLQTATATQAFPTTIGKATTASLRIGGTDHETSSRPDDDVALVAIFRRALTRAEIYALSRNPWLVFAPEQRSIYFQSVGAAARTLAADGGSFILTGADVTLIDSGAAKVMPTDGGSFAVTGADVGLLRGRRIAADGGSFAITGDNFLVDLSIAADSGSYAVTGADVALTYSGAAKVMPTDGGSFAVTGADVGLLRNRRVAADSGSFTLSGADVGLIEKRRIGADGGSFVVTGADVGLLEKRRIGADGGSYAVTGADITLVDSGGGAVLAAEAGSFTVAGADVGLLLGRRVASDAAVFALTGADVTLQRGRAPLAIDGGMFAATGADVGFLRLRVLAADGGSFAVAGADVTLNYSGMVLPFVPVGSSRGRIGNAAAQAAEPRIGSTSPAASSRRIGSSNP